MQVVPSMVSMAGTPEEKSEAVIDSIPSINNQPDYPYGLCISLCHDELEKLSLSEIELNVGDLIHMHCMAEVTSISNNDSKHSGPSRRVELQITHISAENEAEEDRQAPKVSAAKKMSKLYTS